MTPTLNQGQGGDLFSASQDTASAPAKKMYGFGVPGAGV